MQEFQRSYDYMAETQKRKRLYRVRKNDFCILLNFESQWL